MIKVKRKRKISNNGAPFSVSQFRRGVRKLFADAKKRVARDNEVGVVARVETSLPRGVVVARERIV